MKSTVGNAEYLDPFQNKWILLRNRCAPFLYNDRKFPFLYGNFLPKRVSVHRKLWMPMVLYRAWNNFVPWWQCPENQGNTLMASFFSKHIVGYIKRISAASLPRSTSDLADYKFQEVSLIHIIYIHIWTAPRKFWIAHKTISFCLNLKVSKTIYQSVSLKYSKLSNRGKS